MNNVYITHSSAFQIIRNNRNMTYPDNYPSSNDVPKNSDNICAKYLLDIKNRYNEIIRSDLDITITSEITFNISGIKIHKYNGKYPAKSFYKINNGLYISSPECLFCQMASCVDIEKLIILGTEMCGTYSLDLSTDKGFCSNTLPITTANNINKYAKSLQKIQPHYKNIKKILRASSIVKDNSASPQESRMYVMLCAPTTIGGFGINGAHLNYEIKLSKAASKICHKQAVVADLCIPKSKVIVEYDSDAFHDNTNQNRKDKARMNALNHDGWKVINIVPTIIHDADAFKQVAFDIIKATGKRPRIRVENFNQLQSNLHDKLY